VRAEQVYFIFDC